MVCRYYCCYITALLFVLLSVFLDWYVPDGKTNNLRGWIVWRASPPLQCVVMRHTGATVVSSYATTQLVVSSYAALASLLSRHTWQPPSGYLSYSTPMSLAWAVNGTWFPAGCPVPHLLPCPPQALIYFFSHGGERPDRGSFLWMFSLMCLCEKNSHQRDPMAFLVASR